MFAKFSSSGGELADVVIRQLEELAKSEAAVVAASYAELLEPGDGEELPPWVSPDLDNGPAADFEALDADVDAAWHDAATIAFAAVPSHEEQEAWIATGCDVDARWAEVEEMREQAAPAPDEPCLSSFVDTSEIFPASVTLSGGGGDVDNSGDNYKPDEETAPRPQLLATRALVPVTEKGGEREGEWNTGDDRRRRRQGM
eukprot:XP_008680694.1 uncharacterized protein LOC103655775 [Zea mays]